MEILNILSPLLSLGAPGLLMLIAALVVDRRGLLQEVKEERSRTEAVVKLLVDLNAKLIATVLEENSKRP